MLRLPSDIAVQKEKCDTDAFQMQLKRVNSLNRCWPLKDRSTCTFDAYFPLSSTKPRHRTESATHLFIYLFENESPDIESVYECATPINAEVVRFSLSGRRYKTILAIEQYYENKQTKMKKKEISSDFTGPNARLEKYWNLFFDKCASSVHVTLR